MRKGAQRCVVTYFDILVVSWGLKKGLQRATSMRGLAERPERRGGEGSSTKMILFQSGLLSGYAQAGVGLTAYTLSGHAIVLKAGLFSGVFAG